jgi:hypothetical protein
MRTITTHWARWGVALLGVGALVASCTAKEASPPRQPLSDVAAGAAAGPSVGPPTLPPAAAAHLDSGNVAYRGKQFDAALAHYRAAATAAPDHAAPWYGVYMVGEATNNRVLVDSANAMVASRSGAAINDSVMGSAHGGGGAAAPSGLPSGHPSVSPTLPPGHPAPTPKSPNDRTGGTQ